MEQKKLQDFFPPPSHFSKTAVIYDDGNACSILSYAELESLSQVVTEILSNENGLIGVGCYQNTFYPAILLGILKSGCGFYNLDKQNQIDDLLCSQKQLHIKCFVFHSQWLSSQLRQIMLYSYIQISVPGCPDLQVFRKNFCPFKAPEQCEDAKIRDYAYVIKTSGTTNTPKFVFVSHDSIVPNIFEFIHTHWSMKPSDVIFGVSPVTFDPSIVDLFVALGSGSSILYTTSKMILVGENFSRLCVKHKVSILQATPSLLRLNGADLKLRLQSDRIYLKKENSQCLSVYHMRATLDLLN